MILIDLLRIYGKQIIGIRVDLPKAPLLVLRYGDVVIGCGYFSKEVLEKLGIPACVVSGVRDFNDVLDAKIRYATSKAKDLGAKEGMEVKEFLRILK